MVDKLSSNSAKLTVCVRNKSGRCDETVLIATLYGRCNVSEWTMEPKFHDDKVIARYLLGGLSEAEQTQLEEQAFSDRDYLQNVRAVEKDLMDEYVRGELSGPEREAFEQRFFASESRRRQIEFASALMQVAGESPARASSDAAAAAT